MNSRLLQYTGHPLVDVGVATIVAYAGRQEPAQVTETDLENFASYMEDIYFGGRWKGMMAISFINSPYTQPRIGPEKKERHRTAFIYGFRGGFTGSERCAFCQRPTSIRAFRQHIPLLTGEGVVNFFPWGQTGLPICGVCSLAIQGFPLGSVRCAGRMLLVHSDNHALTQDFAGRFLAENRRFLSLATVTEQDEEAQNLKYPRTYFLHWLRNIEQERQDSSNDDKAPCSVTVYHLTNYGTNPDVTMYHLPYQLLRFIRRVNRAPHGNLWRRIEHRAWELAITEGGRSRNTSGDSDCRPQYRVEPGRVRNYLYEDLFALPRDAAHFVRTYLLRRAYRTAFSEDPRKDYSLSQELDLVSWALTEIFLKEVMNMESGRIETIRRVADRLAGCIRNDNNARLFRDLWMSERYVQLRLALVRESMRQVHEGKEPLMTFDEFIEIFEFGEDSQRPDWNLARDLMLVRVIEELHRDGWFDKHRNAIEDVAVGERPETASTLDNDKEDQQ